MMMDNPVAATLRVQTPNGRVMSSEHPAFWNGIPPNFFVNYEMDNHVAAIWVFKCRVVEFCHPSTLHSEMAYLPISLYIMREEQLVKGRMLSCLD